MSTINQNRLRLAWGSWIGCRGQMNVFRRLLRTSESYTENIQWDTNWDMQILNRIIKSNQIYIFTYLYRNLTCLSVCLFVSNIRQNGWTARAQIFCGTSRDHREGLWMIKISNICLHQNSIFNKFLKVWKSTKFFVKIRELFLFCFTMYTKRTCSQLIKKMGAQRPIRLVE